MAISSIARGVCVLALAGCGCFLCLAQTYTPPPPPLSTLPPCPAQKDQAAKMAKKKLCDPANTPPPASPKTPAPAESFPYPGEKQPDQPDGSAAKQFPYPGEEKSASGEDTRSADQYSKEQHADPDTSASKAFPYPGDLAPNDPASTKTAPAKSTPAEGHQSESGSQAGSSSSSSSSSPDDEEEGRVADSNEGLDDGDKPRLTDKGSEGRHGKKAVKPQSDTERVDEDLSVAKFYTQSGNIMGAYLRARDAVKTQPDYPEAHFVLGEAAKRLNKQDEAKSELRMYLKIAPDGDRAKEAEKDLSELK